MYYTIYKTTNLINGKIYIGKHQTLDPNDSYIGSGKHLNYAIKKYGRENFVKEVLHIFDNEDDMNAKEKELVTEELLARDDVYNMCPGGQGGFGYINSNYSILRIEGQVKANKARRKLLQNKLDNDIEFNKDFRNKLSIGSKRGHAKRSNYNIDQLISESANAKRKQTFSKIGHSQGSKNSQYGSMWITNGDENKKIKKEDLIPFGWHKGRKCS